MIDDKNKKEIFSPRVRFAPSPTGYFHIGSARTALFNWLTAKKYNGVFVLRIEDTNKERSKPEFEQDIIEQMKWLGFDWDEGPEKDGKFGPYRQSQRSEIYKKFLIRLLEEKKAYYCFCGQEELEARRQEAAGRGEAFKYDGRCRNISLAEAEEKIKNGDPCVIRIKIPEKVFSFDDAIKGRIENDGSLLGDQVIAKDLNSPLYNFSVVIDDHEMQITHVIRGEDHISNTPKQLAIYEAFGWEPPIFGHLPLILSPDRSKMSKRFGSTSVQEYRDLGYLAEALFNFLVFLGWHPSEKNNQVREEIMSRREIIDSFDLSRIQKGGAVFNSEKLDWINFEYMKKTPANELFDQFRWFFEKNFSGVDRIVLEKILKSQKERIRKISDFSESAGYFLKIGEYDASLLVWKETPLEKIKSNLDIAFNILNNLEESDFQEKELEKIIMPESEKTGNRGEFLWPLRVALSGLKNSAGPFEIMSVIGKKESLKRISAALEKISAI